MWLVVVLNIMIRSKYYDYDYKRNVMDFVGQHIKEINESNYLSKIRKIQMNILIRSYNIYVITYILYLKLYRK